MGCLHTVKYKVKKVSIKWKYKKCNSSLNVFLKSSISASIRFLVIISNTLLELSAKLKMHGDNIEVERDKLRLQEKLGLAKEKQFR